MQLQLGDALDAVGDFAALFADARRHFTQNALDFRLLFFQQAHQLVVLLDGLQRFDKHRLSAGTGAMDDSLHPPLVLGFHGNDKAFAANGNQFFLQRSAFGEPPQIAAQRFLDQPALTLDFAANPAQDGRSVIVERAVGQQLAAKEAQQLR